MEPHFLTIEEINSIHDSQIKLYGGREGVRDQEILESAINTPQAGTSSGYLHKSIFEMAAAYAFHIGQNQPFNDGNKRTGTVAAHTFLYMNGYLLDCDQDLLVETVMKISSKECTKLEFAEFLKSHTTPFEVSIIP